MPAFTRRVAHRIGHRGACLLFLAFLDVVFGYYLAFPPRLALHSPLYVYLASILPLGVWAALWLGVGVVCLVQAFMRNDFIGFALAAALKALWGVVNVVAWISQGVPQGYVSGAIWAAFAAFVMVIADWPEQLDDGG